MFWIQCLCAVILLGSGIVLWWPEAMSRQWRLIAIVLHPASAVLSMAGIIIIVGSGLYIALREARTAAG